VVLLSVTEGDDKPAKYPKAFRTSHALVVSKTDLLPYVPFDVERAAVDARSIQPDMALFTTTIRDAGSFDAWCDYLAERRRRMLEGERCRPHR
jgi:hydrogenase nickel incorporation protein HypB